MSTALGALFEFLFKYRPLVFAKGDLALGEQSPQVLQGRAGDVPARFRAYVEQYYRSLASPKP